jgi:arginyl-tRNA synthetase
MNSTDNKTLYGVADLINQHVREILSVDEIPRINLTRPEPQFGDLATNVALQLAKPLGTSPREIAEKLAASLRSDNRFSEVTVAGPGFINIRLSDATLATMLDASPEAEPSDGSIVIETNNPNPFKDLHIGHAYNCIVADTMANLLDLSHSQVHRVSYHGDVGLHVGKSMWAILRYIDGDIKKLDEVDENERPSFLSRMYVEGAKAHEGDEAAKAEIEKLAEQSFILDDPIYKSAYETCRAWSFEYLADTVERLGSKPTERRYLESEADAIGVATVKKHVGDVFEESDGAIIFSGEKHGLHTRVFVSSRDRGLYEARDLGLMQLKQQEFHPQKSYIVTGGEQREYFNVVIKAAELSLPELSGVTTNIPTGTVKLTTGKMSSRTGEVINIEWLFDQLEDAAKARADEADRNVILGALRYALLKVRVGSDIIFDIEESLSIEGNSGPYLQYAHARARSILAKREVVQKSLADEEFDENERVLVTKLTEFHEVLDRAADELLPHLVCTYLYEMAQTFNRFYEQSRVLDDPREGLRLQLALRYANTLKNGLQVLGIPAPERL